LVRIEVLLLVRGGDEYISPTVVKKAGEIQKRGKGGKKLNMGLQIEKKKIKFLAKKKKGKPSQVLSIRGNFRGKKGSPIK